MKDKYYIIHKGIARWKLNNSFENWLSYKADKSEFWKFVYVSYYKWFDRKYYKVGLKYLNLYLDLFKKQWEGLNRDYIIRDMIYSLHRFGADFQDYWNYNFLGASAFGRDSFVVDKLRYGYDDILSTPETIKLVSDKYACYMKLCSYYKRDVLGCYDEISFVEFLKFVKKNHTFVCKPISGDCGKGVRKIILADADIKSFFYENIKIGAFIVEELIDQHESMSKIHVQSVNTVRVVTFVQKGRVEILAASLRMGVGDSVTDNAGNGGIFSSIDPETGIVICKARDYKGNEYVKHPDSKIVIPGFQIPAWDELMGVAKEVALELENATLISWDFSYSSKGWVIVEVNTGGDWIILQAAQKEPMKKKLYKLIDELQNEKR